MEIIPYISGIIGVALLVYAVYGMIFPSGAKRQAAPRRKPGAPPDGVTREQKVERMEAQIASLQEDLGNSKTNYEKLAKELEIEKAKHPQLQDELARRQDWVAKSEEMLNKVKQENLELRDKFILKEKELQGEFAKVVDLNKGIRELNEKVHNLEEEIKDKSDQIEAQKHKIEKYIQDVSQHKDTIEGFKNKEKVSEWVPKTEFNKLNEEYTELEKDLEAKEERLKSFAQEIVQLKNQLSANQSPITEKPAEQPEPVKPEPVIELPQPKQQEPPAKERVIDEEIILQKIEEGARQERAERAAEEKKDTKEKKKESRLSRQLI